MVVTIFKISEHVIYLFIFLILVVQDLVCLAEDGARRIEPTHLIH